MNFVIIEKRDNPPPADAVIIKAMTESGGSGVTVDPPAPRTGSKRVNYTGTVNHDTFENALMKEGNGRRTSWSYQWGDSLASSFSLAVVGTLGTRYTIVFHNTSQIDAQAIVFQKDPQLPEDVHTLAWLSKTCHPGTQARFDWTLDFSFVWGQNGALQAGANYEAGQVLGADLTTQNQVTLQYVDDGFEFGPVSRGPQQGSLLIHEDLSVPGPGNPNQGCVGIGMSNAGTFVRPTQPTGDQGGLAFDVHPEYWVAFGSYLPGRVVDESVLYFPAPVEFPVGQFTADCTLTDQGWEPFQYSQ